MEKYKYGPLVYITVNDTDEDGNFYFFVNPPVGYDEMGIPIDQNGHQCLSIESPLHPGYEPKNPQFNDTLNDDIPSLEEVRTWFDELFLIVSDYQIKKYILRWYSLKRASYKSTNYRNLLAEHLSVNEMIDRIWPDEQIS